MFTTRFTPASIRRCLLVLLTLLTAQVHAATYYLDSRLGNDNNDGLKQTSAWASLDRVNATTFAPGDRILFKAGTVYAGQLRPQGSGAIVEGIVRPIEVGVWGDGPRPRIEARGLTREALELHNVEYWEIEGLEITNTGEERAPRRAGVLLRLNDFGTALHIELRNLYIHDVNGSNVKAEGGGAGISIEVSGRTTPSRYDGLLIENCRLERCDRNGITGGGSTSRNNWFPSINVVIRGNVLEDIGGDGIVPMGCDGALVEYNVLRNSGTRFPPGDAAAGIWPWSCDNTIIQFNEVSGQRGHWDAQGFDSDWNCSGTLIQYNYSHDNEGGFLLVCNNGGSRGSDNVGNVGTIVRYNLSVNDGYRSTGEHAGFSPIFHISGPVRGTRIYNNTIFIWNRPDMLDHTLVKFDTWGGWPDDTVFANNIFYGAGWSTFDYGQSTNHRFINNLYFGEFRRMPDDPRALTVDPMLRQPGNHDSGLAAATAYRPREGSLAIAAGTPIENNGGRDLLGQPIPTDRPPTIGAIEFGR